MTTKEERTNLHLLEDGLLEFPLHLLAGIVLGRLAVKGEESTKIELGLLEELDLADVHLGGVSKM